MKKRSKLKKGLAILLAVAMVVGLLPGVGTMQVSAEETSTTASVKFSALDGAPEGNYSEEWGDERYPMLLDGMATTKWCCSFEGGSAYVIFKASQPICVNGYSVWTANDTGEENGVRNPVAWTLSACNDYDETNNTSGTWQKIHEVEVTEYNSEDALPAENLAEKSYSFEPTTENYQYFKLNITSITSGMTMQLGDFALTYDACEHQWEKTDETIAPTCTEGGYDIEKCSLCQATRNVANGTSAKGHEWVSGDTVAPTCTEHGYTPQTCSVCGEKQETDIKDALGHTFDNEICTRCGLSDTTLKEPSKVNNVYQIGTAGELYWFADKVNNDNTNYGNADAVLTADIKVNSNLLSSLKYDKDGNVINGDSFSGWTPIGNESNSYTGTFDGQGFTVSGLYVNNTDFNTGRYVGLFGRVASDGKVSKVGVVDSYFNAYKFVGGVCGYNKSGDITECYNKGTVNGNDMFTGGVCGGNSSGTIQNCYNEGSVTGKNEQTGGVCGGNENASIINCYNTGKVVGNISGCGGVCGYNYTGGTIQNCYNIGMVSLSTTVNESAIGGVCGYNKSTITNCYFDSDKYTGTAVGGTGAGSNVSDNVLGKTTEQFASGEIAYLLQDGQETGENSVKPEVWGQTLSENGDTYPVLKKTGDAGNTVYTFTCGENNAYTNDNNLSGTTQSHDYSAKIISDYAKKSDATCTEKAKYYYSCTHCRAVEKNDEAVFEDGELAEHTDEDLDGKCDVCTSDFKTFEQLGKLIIKVNQNLSGGKYANVQYTTASIDNLRKALVAANAITAESSDTDVAAAFDNLLAASTVGAGGLIKADHNIVIAFADEGTARGIASGNGWYANGDTVTLKVTPSVGYTFSKWTTDTAGDTSSVETESTYTFKLAEDSLNTYYAWLDEVKYTVTCNTAEGGTCSTDAEGGKYVYGKTATVTATADANYEFVGWKDSYGTTVSTDAVYSFTVLGDTTLTPDFVKVKTDEGADITYVTVSFYHQSGKLLDSQKVVSGEGQITTTVNAPTKVGFDFLGWSTKASGATVGDVVNLNTAIFSEDTSLYPVFAVQNITYTLTVDLQTEQKAPQSSVTVTADPIEGKQFVGWKNADGNIVSYDSTYTFIITGNTTLTSYYEPINAVIEKTPTISMSAPVGSVKEEGISKKATMYFNYEIPENYTLTDIGVIYISGEVEELDINTTGAVIRSAKSTIENTSNAAKNQFYYSKTVLSGQSYTFVGYITYTDAAGRRITVYSNLCSTNYQGL